MEFRDIFLIRIFEPREVCRIYTLFDLERYHNKMARKLRKKFVVEDNYLIPSWERTIKTNPTRRNQ